MVAWTYPAVGATDRRVMADPTQVFISPGLALMRITDPTQVQVVTTHDSADGDWYTLYFGVENYLGGSIALAGTPTALKEMLTQAGRRLQEATGEIPPED
jgi:hypothetical protein